MKQQHFRSASKPMQIVLTEINKFGNPFIINDEEFELVQLDTRNAIKPKIVKSINEIQRVGKEQADQFMNSRSIHTLGGNGLKNISAV